MRNGHVRRNVFVGIALGACILGVAALGWQLHRADSRAVLERVSQQQDKFDNTSDTPDRPVEARIEDVRKWLAEEVLVTSESHIEIGYGKTIKTDIEDALRSVQYDEIGYYVTPDGWDRQLVLLRKALKNHAWAEAEANAKTLEEILPTPLPQTHPWAWDTPEQFQAGRAQLLFFAGKIEESKELCLEIVEWMVSARNPKDGPIYIRGGRNSVALMDTQNLLSRIYAFEGEFADSASALKAARSAYNSWCGTCSRKENVWHAPIEQVLSACAQPGLESMQELTRIRSGDIEIVTSERFATDSSYQTGHAWTEATLALAWYANRSGDPELAELFLEQAARGKSSCRARDIAQVWLENGALRATSGSS